MRLNDLGYMTRKISTRWYQLLVVDVALVLGCVGPSIESALPSEQQEQLPSAPSSAATPDSGIYGNIVAARGNPPTHRPAQCLKVFDSSAVRLIKTGTCSGMWGNFRVGLAPGRYVVEIGGNWRSVNGAVTFVPNRRTVEVSAGQWVKVPPSLPAGPVP